MKGDFGFGQVLVSGEAPSSVVGLDSTLSISTGSPLGPAGRHDMLILISLKELEHSNKPDFFLFF